MDELATPENPLGAYLRDRRGKLDPAALGFSAARRRTPGLRREEVAQRANISPTWYTSLEQGRGGAPSAEVLDRIAGALLLTDFEREHLFLLGLGRSPKVRYKKVEGVTPRLQRVLDALDPSPALIRTVLWDVVAWNRAAVVMLMDYQSLPPEDRNILRFTFLNPRVRAVHGDKWEAVARFVVGSFRADVARASAAVAVQPLVDDLSQLSAEFRSMWRENDVHAAGEAVKHMKHPILGPIEFEYSAFAVDGRPGLSLVVYNPRTPADADKISSLIDSTPALGV
jgi:transcriptional regulator with XRE-family HTH domain